MTELCSSLYAGTLLHRRYTPRRHAFHYHVMNVFIDVDELEATDRNLWLFSYNARSLFSIHDRNHGPGDGTPIATYIRGVMEQLGSLRPICRIFMFCSPAAFGYVFNPLTVYFGYDARQNLVAMVYEVNNTFGQRHSYAIGIDGQETHVAEKQLYVSPFNPVRGEYRFNCSVDPKHLRLNIALFEDEALKLCARFTGDSKALSDAVLLRSVFSLLVQPIKIIAGIHWEALKLCLKGLRPQLRPEQPKFLVSLSKDKS